MAEIFISYRREDSSGSTRDLWHRLRTEFETDDVRAELVFLDVADRTDIEPWPDRLRQELASSSVVLVVIGRKWLKVEQHGKRRLDDEKDWVRQEIESAIWQRKEVIPVLVDDAQMPEASDLPEGDLRRLLEYRNEIIRHRGVDEDVERLIKRIMHPKVLPKNSIARSNSQLHPAETKRLIVCRYELTGLAEAMAEKANDWRGPATFEDIAPTFVQKTRALVERNLLEVSQELPWQSLSDGAIFFIDPGEDGDKTLAEIARKSRGVVAGYVDFVQGFAERDPRGLNWVVDMRLVITVGQVSKVWGRDLATAERFVGFSGKPLNGAAFLLGHRDGRGRPLVRRGDVVVLPGAGGTMPEGFIRHDDLPGKWHPDARGQVVGPEAALGGATTAWLARRASVTSQHFRIQEAVVDTLTKRTLTTDERAEDLLRHVPPSNYEDIARRAKTNERFCIIVGKAGTGKTLCGLRLVAEMMHIDGLDVSIPPVTGETWNRLASQSNSDLVVFLDDAFGRTRVLGHVDLDAALLALGDELPDGIAAAPDEPGAVAETSPAFLRQRRDRRPALIITVRQDIWDAACRNPAWKAALGRYAAVIDEKAYSEEDRIAVFANYWRTRDGQPRPINAALRESVKTITHPLSIRDFARECAHLEPAEASRELARYKNDALGRYLTDLESHRRTAPLLWHFLTWTFGGALLERDELRKLYLALASQLGPGAGRATEIWEENEQQQHWGRWEQNGYFTPAHPLRAEAVEKFFRDDRQHELIDSFFKAFLDAPPIVGVHETLKLAAFAAPRVTGKMGPHRREVIASASANPDGDAARVMASSIGQAFRNALADPTLAQDSETRPVLIQALQSLLGSADKAAFGAAFAALCDSFPGPDEIPTDLRKATEIALEQLSAACPLREIGGTAESLTRRGSAQNVEHSVWAIASNFARVPPPFRDQLAALVERGSDDWLRLRAIEAAADYITAMEDDDADGAQRVAPRDTTTTVDKFEDYILRATDRGQPDIMRRGVAGAIEANFDDLSFAAGQIASWLGSTDERYNYGFLEWVIWAAGEHLDHYRKHDVHSLTGKEFIAAILKLARHEDSRVRKWLATALAESEVTKEDHTLRAVMDHLARDDDDLVRDVAVDFFFESNG